MASDPADVVSIENAGVPRNRFLVRKAVRAKLQRALALVPSIDPALGERDVAGDEIENILMSIVCEDLAHLAPPPSVEQVRKVADQRAEALRAAKLDDIVDRIAVRAQRLGHMIAIGAGHEFIASAGYESSFRAAADELCARIPAPAVEEEPS